MKITEQGQLFTHIAYYFTPEPVEQREGEEPVQQEPAQWIVMAVNGEPFDKSSHADLDSLLATLDKSAQHYLTDETAN